MNNSYLIDLYNLTLLTVKTILDSGAMTIRDVDKGEDPFLYASGWKGPGYILFKALVSWDFFKKLVMILALKVAAKAPKITFVAGNVTGGVIPGWLLSQYLEILLGHPVHFMYVSGTRDLEEAKKKPVYVVNKAALELAAIKICDAVILNLERIDFVAGGAPGGMPLAYRVSELLSIRLQRHVPFVYVRDKRKAGGHGEMITGIQNNPFFKKGMIGLAIGSRLSQLENDGTDHVVKALEEEGFVGINFHRASGSDQLTDFLPEMFENLEHVLQPNDPRFCSKEAEGIVAEELTNFAHSTTVSASLLEYEYSAHVPNAACLLFYAQPKAIEALAIEGMEMISLISLPEMLKAARSLGTHYGRLIKSYLSYLAAPVAWNERRGIKRKEQGGTI